MDNKYAINAALPKPCNAQDALRSFQKWSELAAAPANAPISVWMLAAAGAQNAALPLMAALFGNSPYLTRLLLLHPGILHDFTQSGPDAVWNTLLQQLVTVPGEGQTELMERLRIAKGKAALLTALADISGAWMLEQVTLALSLLAERSLVLAMDTILLTAHNRGEIALPHPEKPSFESGVIALGMGKLGGRELNYSSDIDLILLYEPGRIQYKGRLSEQKFMTRMSHDLVTIMQERTPHGYVFRTDLRLRPDPASTPPAVNTEAAYYYYESVGQNWERAAMIKARPVAGDIMAGERFLKHIAPFMWRRSLDFAAINDIHSIKRQMDSVHGEAIALKGHNVKLGKGGIREIEFYVQIHQLIWGGREPSLRLRSTCDTLDRLTECGLVEESTRRLMREAYAFFRSLEHRLQMIDDAQTHSLPETDEGLRHIACFMGFTNIEAFEKRLIPLLSQIHDIYVSSFKQNESKDLGSEGNLVFTGVSHDPDTLRTLRNMGYDHPETVSEIVMGWHHGSTRATRSKRAREILTELMPILLQRLSKTVQPDTAFLKFHEFLSHLPSGVQLFSLFNANPQLLGLIADIMGSAPLLADRLSKSPELLDAVLYEDFYLDLPTPQQLHYQLDLYLKDAPDAETRMDRIRYFRNEKQFQAGVQMLKNLIDAKAAGLFLSQLADVAAQKTFAIVHEEFTKTYGHLEGSQFATIALGKLGSLELTFSSDIDLVFIYDTPDFEALSDGEKGFSPSVYFNRLAQRFVSALTATSRAGKLYDVDTRLRPSGKQGLLAVSTQALRHYFTELAWTFEFMAFTKARVIIGGEPIAQDLTDFARQLLSQPRDLIKLATDASNMRERINKEFPASSPWDIKYVRGGLLDCDFLAQYLLLLHGSIAPGTQCGSATDTFIWLRNNQLIDKPIADSIIDSIRFLEQVFQMLRLCSDRDFNEATAPEGLKKLLVESVKEKDFESLKNRLIQVEQTVQAHYIVFLQPNPPPEDV